MQFEYDEEKDITRILAERGEDVCTKCGLREICPLICAIAGHIVYPSAENLIISNCNFYQVINDDDNDEKDEET